MQHVESAPSLTATPPADLWSPGARPQAFDLPSQASRAYYNEIDPYAAQWLRNLIAAGHIAPGDVDERSIVDVKPADLAGYKQCHFFAGVGVWSHALRRAGWGDHRPAWTGSCPCQPFSAAGKGAGFADERHLWPAWFHLISQCRPERVFGEQVASKDGLGWLDLVQADLEGAGYACGPIDLCAAGLGAPHIRQRLWFVADASRQGRPRRRAIGEPVGQTARGRRHPHDRGAGRLADTTRGRRRIVRHPLEPGDVRYADGRDLAGGLADADGERQRVLPPRRLHDQGSPWDDAARRGEPLLLGHAPGQGRQGFPDRRGDVHAQCAPVERTGGDACGLADAGRDRDREQPQIVPGHEGQHGDGHPDGDHASLGRRATGLLADAAGRQFQEPLGRSQARDGSRSNGAVHDGQPGPVNGLWRDADWLRCRDGKWRPVGPGTFPLAHGVAARVGRLRAYGNAINAEAAAAVIMASMTPCLEKGDLAMAGEIA